MDNKTTGPNGRSNAKNSKEVNMNNKVTGKNVNGMNVIENSEDIQRRIEEAGYSFKLEVMEAEFSYDKVKSTDSNNNSSASSEENKRAGDYTNVGATATLAFKPLIPAIAEGPKVKVKGKIKAKEEKTNEGPDMSLDD